MKLLFLDDERFPEQCVNWMKRRNPADFEIYYTQDYCIVKNYDSFVNWIIKNGLPEIISFDHDLADEHYNKYYYDGTFKEKTGYDCAKWLKEYCDSKNLKYPKILIHTMNPVGQENIISVFG